MEVVGSGRLMGEKGGWRSGGMMDAVEKGRVVVDAAAAAVGGGGGSAGAVVLNRRLRVEWRLIVDQVWNG